MTGPHPLGQEPTWEGVPARPPRGSPGAGPQAAPLSRSLPVAEADRGHRGGPDPEDAGPGEGKGKRPEPGGGGRKSSGDPHRPRPRKPGVRFHVTYSHAFLLLCPGAFLGNERSPIHYMFRASLLSGGGSEVQYRKRGACCQERPPSPWGRGLMSDGHGAACSQGRHVGDTEASLLTGPEGLGRNPGPQFP